MTWYQCIASSDHILMETLLTAKILEMDLRLMSEPSIISGSLFICSLSLWFVSLRSDTSLICHRTTLTQVGEHALMKHQRNSCRQYGKFTVQYQVSRIWRTWRGFWLNRLVCIDPTCHRYVCSRPDYFGSTSGHLGPTNSPRRCCFHPSFTEYEAWYDHPWVS